LWRVRARAWREIATAAGIARGTLYRHFPTRESLLRALEGAANGEAGRRLAEANLDGVPVDEALARVVRALVAVGEDFIVLLCERRPPEPGFAGPLVALVERGRANGEIRMRHAGAGFPLPHRTFAGNPQQDRRPPR
jgi:AcrR family transcriptional regulator